MTGTKLHDRLRSLDRPLGDRSCALLLGPHSVRIEGLDRGLRARLGERWGEFLVERPPGPARCTLLVLRAGPGKWLDRWLPGESYRLEALGQGAGRIVASYHFALCPEQEPRHWRVGITEEPEEPLDRIMDNVLRFLAATLAVEERGFAMHAAGVLHEGRAFLFAGPSRAGKTTAVELARPAQSLGDDFGVVLPRGDGWVTMALPFDNSERIRHRPPRGLFPVAGVFRLRRSAATRVESLPRALAVAALMGCTAFPWAMPEQAERLLAAVDAFVAQGRFRELYLAKGPGLWAHLTGAAEP